MTTQRCPFCSSWAAFTATAMALPELPPAKRTVRFAHKLVCSPMCMYSPHICANTLEGSVGTTQACITHMVWKGSYILRKDLWTLRIIFLLTANRAYIS